MDLSHTASGLIWDMLPLVDYRLRHFAPTFAFPLAGRDRSLHEITWSDYVHVHKLSRQLPDIILMQLGNAHAQAVPAYSWGGPPHRGLPLLGLLRLQCQLQRLWVMSYPYENTHLWQQDLAEQRTQAARAAASQQNGAPNMVHLPTYTYEL
eukprot:scaffold45592_cov17-Tisochrysis_lutea.AAC.2